VDESQSQLPMLLMMAGGAAAVWWVLKRFGAKMPLSRRLLVTAIGGVVLGGILYGLIYSPSA
jgi:hypothetical protein